MLKKRLIFVLYFDAGFFCLSRNFQLQRVGDVAWLIDRFQFNEIGKFIDEIVILDVTRDKLASRCDEPIFFEAVSQLMKNTFVPLTIGGGIRNISVVQKCFQNGADKILLNSTALLDPDFVSYCVRTYGSQAIVGGIDVLKVEGLYSTRICDAREVGADLQQHLQTLVSLNVGEVLLNCVDVDGTGTGFDFNVFSELPRIDQPVIICGGAGKPVHFENVLALDVVSAAATGNLFNFMGPGFESVYDHLLEMGLPVRRRLK